MINIEEKLFEIKDYIKDKHKISMRENADSRVKVGNLLKNKGFNFMVMYGLAFRDTSKSTTIPCVCLNDGYVSYFQSSHLLKGKIRCEGCRVASYMSHADDIGFTYLSHRSVKNACLVTIKCKLDGEVKEVGSSELFANNVSCAACVTVKYKKAALNCGFEYMTNNLPNGRRSALIRCPIDGDFRTISTSDLLAGKAKCIVCNVNKYKKYLIEKNCTYLSHKSFNGQVFVEYLNNNNEIFEVNSSNLFRKKFAITKETHWNQEHSVYCIQAELDGNIYYKIGTANDPVQRLKDIKLKCKSSVSTLQTFKDRYKAKELESELHSKFSEHRLDATDVEHFIGKEVSRKDSTGVVYRVKDGATEWFNSAVIIKLQEIGYLI